MSEEELIALPYPIDIRRAFVEVPTPHDFVLPGLLPASVGGIVAQGGFGKSFFALQASIAIVTGYDLTGGALQSSGQGTGKVLYLAAEDPKCEIERRLYALGAHLSPDIVDKTVEGLTIHSLVGMIPHILVSNHSYSVAEETTAWINTIRSLAKDMRLVIIDTKRRFHCTDENDAAAMALFIQIIESIAVETGAAFVFLHHTNKASMGNGGAQGAARGSGVVSDNSRWQMNLVLMSEKEARKYQVDESFRENYVRVVQSKVNYAAKQEDHWLERAEGGVLVPANLELYREPTKLNKRKRDAI